MVIIVNFLNQNVEIFDNIISISDSNEKDYLLTDSFNNEIKIPRLNVQYILIDKN